MPLPSLELSFAALRLGPEVGAPSKRKAPCGGHFGVSSDSSLPIRLIAVSRLVRSRDEPILTAAAASPVGTDFLAALRAATLRVALAGGADPALSEANITTLLNMSGSTIAWRPSYDGGLSLPTRLPWAKAKALIAALLNGIAAARATEVGNRVADRLLRTPVAPSDAAAHADLTAAIATIEATMASCLGDASAASSSSASSSRSTPPPPPLLVATPPFALDAALSMSANVRRLIETRIQRALSEAEAATLEEKLEEGLSVLQAGGADERRRLLSSTAFVALANPGVAQLWACCLDATEDEVPNAPTLADGIVNRCSRVAGVLFASALCL